MSRHYSNRRRRNLFDHPVFDELGVVAIIALFVIAAVGAIWWAVAKNNAVETRTCTVQSKDMTKDSKGHSIYQVYTAECGTVRVDDNPMRGVWNSADIYGGLLPDHRYQLTLIGWRIPVLSEFQEIVKVVPA